MNHYGCSCLIRIALFTCCISSKKWVLIASYYYGQKNHLSGLHRRYLKISFDTVQQLMDVKKDLVHVVERNQEKFDAAEAYESILMGKR